MKRYIIFITFIFACFYSYAQENAYLIPRQIFIGDRSTLVLPLPGAVESSDIILTPSSSNYPWDPDIDFHRILLERRVNGSRLLIEFTPFATGILELPVIEIGGNAYSGLLVTVNSIIDNNTSPVLSGPASSLAMPGTALMLYGAMAIIIVFIFIAVWFLLKGRNFLQKWKERYKRWKFFNSVKKMEKRLHGAVLEGIDKRIVLDNLSEQFRIFLSYITKRDCLSMTSLDFKKYPLDLPASDEFSPLFLGDFFRACDKLRFSGINVDSNEILKLLAELRHFLEEMENARKKKQKGEKTK